MIRRPSLLLAILFVVACSTPKTEQLSDTPTEAIEVIGLTSKLKVDSLIQHSEIAGIAMAKVDSNGVLMATGFGKRNMQGDAYDLHTVQNIGSISKVFIGLTLLKAQELGHLQLDDDINEHLEFPVRNPHFPETPITLRQLATHTSSITDSDFYSKAYVLLPGEAALTDSLSEEYPFLPSSASMSLGDFMAAYLKPEAAFYDTANFITHTPGTWFEYSNVAAALAALVIERAVGEPFDKFSERHILAPLKMEDSSWSYKRVNKTNRSNNFISTDVALPLYELVTYPDGGMLTSAHDMALFMQELIRGLRGEGTLLTKESYAAYYRGQLDSTYFEERDAEFEYNDEYDMGIFMGLSASEHIGHSGGDPGISSFMFINKETGLGRYIAFNAGLESQERFDFFVALWNEMEEN